MTKKLLSFDGFKTQGATLVVTPIFIAILAGAVHWPNTALSDRLLEYGAQLAGGLSVDAIPVACLMWVLTTWLLTVVTYFTSISACRASGYNNTAPRDMHKETSLGWIYRTHCAHENTTECLAWLTATIVVAEKMQLDSVLQAKWCLVIALSRTVYPFFYIFNMDAFRTISFAIGFFTAFVMGWTAVFQGIDGMKA